MRDDHNIGKGNRFRRVDCYVILDGSSRQNVHSPPGDRLLVLPYHVAAGIYQRKPSSWRGYRK